MAEVVDIDRLIQAVQAYAAAEPDGQVQAKADLQSVLDAYIDGRVARKIDQFRLYMAEEVPRRIIEAFEAQRKRDR